MEGGKRQGKGQEEKGEGKWKQRKSRGGGRRCKHIKANGLEHLFFVCLLPNTHTRRLPCGGRRRLVAPETVSAEGEWGGFGWDAREGLMQRVCVSEPSKGE